MPEFLNLGGDWGMGAIKLYGPQGGLQVLSQVATNGSSRVAQMIGLKSQRPPLRIERAGQSFYVDAGAHEWGRPVESLDYERLIGAPEMVALFCAALTRYSQRYGALTVPLRLTVGLPMESMMGDEAQKNVAAVRRWMEGVHVWQADEQEFRVQVDEVRITSQAGGALFDYLLDEQGAFIPQRKNHFKAELGIVSIGFNTVELLAVHDRSPVQRFTAGSTVGVRRLLELVNQHQLYSLGELDLQLRAGKLDVAHVLPVWEREVTGAIERKWGNLWKRFAAILLVGGGAVLLKNSLPYRFNGRAFMPDDPVLSIARGLYKLGLLQSKKKTEPASAPEPAPEETSA